MLAITSEQEDLADAVSRFAARHAPIEKTRAIFDSIAAGELPTVVGRVRPHTVFTRYTFPSSFGGQGGTLGRPGVCRRGRRRGVAAGPLLATVTASAVANPADARRRASLIAELAAGTTAAVVLPDQSDVRATAHADGWRLTRFVVIDPGNLCGATCPVGRTYDDGDEHWFVLDTRSAPHVRGCRYSRSVVPTCARTSAC